MTLEAHPWHHAPMKLYELAAALLFATLWPAMAFIWLVRVREK